MDILEGFEDLASDSCALLLCVATILEHVLFYVALGVVLEHHAMNGWRLVDSNHFDNILVL